MRYPRNTNNLQNAKTLRKNMTRQERHLWYDFLRYCTPRFRRQEMIGNYIVDFFCYEAMRCERKYFHTVNSAHPSAQCAHWAPPLQGRLLLRKLRRIFLCVLY